MVKIDRYLCYFHEKQSNTDPNVSKEISFCFSLEDFFFLEAKSSDSILRVDLSPCIFIICISFDRIISLKLSLFVILVGFGATEAKREQSLQFLQN